MAGTALRSLWMLSACLLGLGSADAEETAGSSVSQQPAPAETPADHTQMDHTQMDHAQMDHTQMDHTQMDHTQMDHTQMDHTQMDHTQMDHAQMDHAQMDHAQMDHAQMDHAQMDHSGHGGHAGHEMTFDAAGMVMNTNSDRLPPGCPAVRRDHEFTVRAGTGYAAPFPGNVFGMSQHEFRVEPCSRVTFTFINEDAVRHQFMIHNLPRNLYPQGMFHLEAAGGATKTGTLIVPSGNKTYLVHCDIAQHMEQGMKGQLVAGRGSGDLSSVPGISARFRTDTYRSNGQLLWAAAGAFALMLLGLEWYRRKSR